MYRRFLFDVGECIYRVSFWGYKKYIPCLSLLHIAPAHGCSKVNPDLQVSRFRFRFRASCFRVKGFVTSSYMSRACHARFLRDGAGSNLTTPRPPPASARGEASLHLHGQSSSTLGLFWAPKTVALPCVSEAAPEYPVRVFTGQKGRQVAKAL